MQVSSKRITRLCYYPSCGVRHIGDIFNLPYDVFVFSDQDSSIEKAILSSLKHDNPEMEVSTASTLASVVKFRGKIGFFFFRDNFSALNEIRLAGAKISGMVGLCCGCGEGGNHPDDCVTQPKFLTELVRLIANDADYFIDHAQNPDFHDLDREQQYRINHPSERVQTFFKNWDAVLLGKRARFTLQDLLTIDGNHDGHAPTDYRTHLQRGREQGVLERPDASLLWKLVNVRLDAGIPIIAQYKILVG